MKEEEVFRVLRDVGCCYGCCARFIGLRNPASYANLELTASKYLNDVDAKSSGENANESSVNGDSNGQGPSSDGEGPSAKRVRYDVCRCCVGVLQRQTWPETVEQVADSLRKRNYETDSFACALSSPMCIALREKALQFYLESTIEGYKQQTITPLKEAWKWCFGPSLAAGVRKTLDSGAVCPLLITVNMDYDKDAEELDTVRVTTSSSRHTLRRPENRRTVQDRLVSITAEEMKSFGVPPPQVVAPARTTSVRCTHEPIYIAGRYKKLSRQLSQTPWLIEGKRMMESSVQDLVFAPIAKYYRIDAADTEWRLKFIAAGREDVDVRCLGSGRPFAVEVSDPERAPSCEQLEQLCRQMSGKEIIVDKLRIVGRDDLTLLKKGEEVKEKTYRALCIKLPADIDEPSAEKPTEVTDEDILTLKKFSDGDASCRIRIQQKTPLRVLHRRPLLTRERKILHMDAAKVPGHSNLFTLELRTDAGTYVKEFVHGDLGRTRPSLRDVLAAHVDILALDVAEVHLEW